MPIADRTMHQSAIDVTDLRKALFGNWIAAQPFESQTAHARERKPADQRVMPDGTLEHTLHPCKELGAPAHLHSHLDVEQQHVEIHSCVQSAFF